MTLSRPKARLKAKAKAPSKALAPVTEPLKQGAGTGAQLVSGTASASELTKGMEAVPNAQSQGPPKPIRGKPPAAGRKVPKALPHETKKKSKAQKFQQRHYRRQALSDVMNQVHQLQLETSKELWNRPTGQLKRAKKELDALLDEMQEVAINNLRGVSAEETQQQTAALMRRAKDVERDLKEQNIIIGTSKQGAWVATNQDPILAGLQKKRNKRAAAQAEAKRAAGAEDAPLTEPKAEWKEDWLCVGCGETNFGTRTKCHSCFANAPAPSSSGPKPEEAAEKSEVATEVTEAVEAKPVTLGKRSREDGDKNGAAETENKDTADTESKGAVGADTGTAGKGDKGAAACVTDEEGNWFCPLCQCKNYASRQKCFSCASPRPGFEPKVGDWMCPNCHANNYASRKACFACTAPRPGDLGTTGEKVGDWRCSNCERVNFASRTNCYGCNAPKEKGEVLHNVPKAKKAERPAQDGDWACAGCGFQNFRFRLACRACNKPRPQAQPKADEETAAVPPEMPPAKKAKKEKPAPEAAGVTAGAAPVGAKKQNVSDWECKACGSFSYFKYTACQKCKKPRGKTGFFKGDWVCKACTCANFASKSVCQECQTVKPAAYAVLLPLSCWWCACGAGNPKHRCRCEACGKDKPGLKRQPTDWICETCAALNFQRNVACFVCKAPRGGVAVVTAGAPAKPSEAKAEGHVLFNQDDD